MLNFAVKMVARLSGHLSIKREWGENPQQYPLL